MPATTDPPAALVAALERSRALGFLGPGPIDDHVRHASGFAAALGHLVPRAAVDLGAGGGVPGLVLAFVWPTTSWVFLDAHERRTSFLADAIGTLDLSARARVVRARAESFGRSTARAAADVVVARGFGPPAVTAECAAPLLRVGGHLVVSEPPSDVERWPSGPLRSLGLRLDRIVDVGARFAVLELVEPCDDRWPRRTGVPAKRPLF